MNGAGPTCFDVIVIGLGATGSAAAYHLAKAGQKVLGLDQHAPPHHLGSSHGQTRIIREAYFEHPVYVPLVQRAYELWAELEERAGRRLFQQTGGLMIGPEDGIVFGGAKRSAQEHRLPHQILRRGEVERRFPAFRLDEPMAAVWEPRAGVLFPEACIEAHLALARQAGAEIRCGTTVLGWKQDPGQCQVTTPNGQFTGGQLLICAGAWTGRLLADLGLPLRVERQVLFWFEPLRNPRGFIPEQCPVHLWEFEHGRFFYGFPELGEGVKLALHHEGASVNPDEIDREVHTSDVDRMRAVARRFVPDANGPLRSATVCMYTNTPDGHFLIGRHPRCPQVLIASPCSGHGFKFASAVGEVLKELLTTGASRFDLSLFDLKRLWP